MQKTEFLRFLWKLTPSKPSVMGFSPGWKTEGRRGGCVVWMSCSGHGTESCSVSFMHAWPHGITKTFPAWWEVAGSEGWTFWVPFNLRSSVREERMGWVRRDRGHQQHCPIPAPPLHALCSLDQHPGGSSISICIPSPCSVDEHLSNPDDFTVVLGDEPRQIPAASLRTSTMHSLLPDEVIYSVLYWSMLLWWGSFKGYWYKK